MRRYHPVILHLLKIKLQQEFLQIFVLLLGFIFSFWKWFSLDSLKLCFMIQM